MKLFTGTYEGGCAIMLATPITNDGSTKHDYYELQNRIAAFMRADRGGGDFSLPPLANLHLTLQFVGRDLSARAVSSVIMSAFLIKPITIGFTGHFKRFGTSKGQYIVLEVEKTIALVELRQRVRKFMEDEGLKIRDDFEWDPHVTVLESSTPGTVTSGRAWASRGREDLLVPDPLEPFAVESREVEVKYGQRRMTIDLPYPAVF